MQLSSVILFHVSLFSRVKIEKALSQITNIGSTSSQNNHQKVVNRGTLGLCVGALRSCKGGLTSKFEKNATNLQCFMFQFGGVGAFFERTSTPGNWIASSVLSLFSGSNFPVAPLVTLQLFQNCFPRISVEFRWYFLYLFSYLML